MNEAASLPPGFRAAGLHCGIKKSGRPDLGLLLAEEPWPLAAVFTRSLLQGACVHLSRENLARSGGRVRAVLVNSGNANCATGAAGLEDGRIVGQALAEILGCPPEEVLFLNTGVIGARLPVEPVLAHLEPLLEQARESGLDDFSRAILTTDTRTKVATWVSDAGPRITGVTKGSGMIHPDMATMLAFALTDGRADDLAASLRRTADRTFHRLTVDGDTSPNDTVLLWSSGREHLPEPVFEDGLANVCRDLCRAIAADGEGATRLITILVRGAASEADAALIGRTIATSLLTKTAVYGRDPNWGRIVAAAARAGVPLDTDHLRLTVGGALLFEGGKPHPENEGDAHHHLEGSAETVIEVTLDRGSHHAECWTCDLSPDYVRINADYRT